MGVQFFSIVRNKMDILPSDDAKAEHTKAEMMYLVLEQIRRGPREYASAFGYTYVTRAVCTSESTATTLQTNLSDNEPDGTFVLLEVPPDQTFPAGLPPGAEHHLRAITKVISLMTL